MAKRVWVIDGTYLYKSAPEWFDYFLLKKKLQSILGEPFLESYYFNVRMAHSAPAQMFFNKWLQTSEPHGPQLIVKLFDVKRIAIRCKECGQEAERYIQKGLDIGIVTQILELLATDELENLTICAGNPDYADAMEVLRNRNIPIDVVGFRETLSAEMQRWGNVIWVDDFWDDIEKTSPHACL